jgi:carbon-monoxide dehydrogenase large subunit
MVAMVAAEALGVAAEDVRVVMGDTDSTPYGLGGWGSRSAAVTAGAILKGASVLRDKALRIASHLLEADPDDLVIGAGTISVRGSERPATTWAEVATIALIRTVDLPPGVDPGLEVTMAYDPPNVQHVPDEDGRMNGVATYTNSSHAAVVSVDVDTGGVEVLEYLVAHDCGRIINPALVEGQIKGGVAQGIGGTLYEDLPYGEDAQPMAVSFMHYLVPSATEVPPISTVHFESPAPEMPFGIKGAGEAGIIGPAAAIATAVEDALSEFGVARGEITSTPITPSMVLGLVRSRVHQDEERRPSAQAGRR